MLHPEIQHPSATGTESAAQQSGKSPDKPVRLGLAISSGGAKGLAHVGVIQVLEENNIPIAAVSGASMGAYVGALWCAGYQGHQLVQLAEEIQTPKILRKLSDPVIRRADGSWLSRGRCSPDGSGISRSLPAR